MPGSGIGAKGVRSELLRKFIERFVEIRPWKRLTVPAFAILQHRHAFPLDGLRHYHARQRVAIAPAFFESFDDVHIIVPVDSESKPSECPEFFRKTIDVEP